MATCLVDTNVLLRLSDGGSPHQALVEQAVSNLRLRGDPVYLTAQNIIEFWAVATRPTEANGFGWSVEQATTEVERLLDFFGFLEDTPAVFAHWLELVTSHSVRGKQVHDARLVAVMRAHGLKHLVTFNTDDFTRYADLILVHPTDVMGR